MQHSHGGEGGIILRMRSALVLEARSCVHARSSTLGCSNTFASVRREKARHLSDHLSPGGEGGIRTLEGFYTLPVFKTGTINRSATSP